MLAKVKTHVHVALAADLHSTYVMQRVEDGKQPTSNSISRIGCGPVRIALSYACYPLFA
jgi:hypothetical protein